MRVDKQSAPLLLAILLLGVPLAAASDLRSLCELAGTSANGRYLVVEENRYKQIDRDTSRIEQMSWQILGSVEPRQGMPTVPGKYWKQEWSVVLEPPFLMQCPWVLVTDDGRFLVLMNGVGPAPNASFWIYRQSEREHKGVLIKEIELGDLWPPDDFPKGTTFDSAMWFDEGAFTFSPDSGTLIYKTPSGRTVRITLSTGAVSKDHD